METMTFPPPGPFRFVIEIGAGMIDVQADERADVVLDIEVRKGPEPEVTRHEGADGTTITIRSRTTRRHEYDIQVGCPRGTSFEVTTGSADVNTHGEVGSIDYRAGSGDLVFERAAGDISVKVGSGDAVGHVVGGSFTMHSGSGDARIREVGGDLTVNTASGDIEAGPLDGDANVTTVSGDVRIGAMRSGQAHLRSVSGDVTVGVAAGTKVFLDLSATSGDVRSEMTPADGPAQDGPSLELHAATVSGDIWVRRV